MNTRQSAHRRSEADDEGEEAKQEQALGEANAEAGDGHAVAPAQLQTEDQTQAESAAKKHALYGGGDVRAETETAKAAQAAAPEASASASLRADSKVLSDSEEERQILNSLAAELDRGKRGKPDQQQEDCGESKDEALDPQLLQPEKVVQQNPQPGPSSAKSSAFAVASLINHQDLAPCAAPKALPNESLEQPEQ